MAKLTEFSEGYVRDITTRLPRVKLHNTKTFNYKHTTYEQFLCLMNSTHNENNNNAYKEFIYLHHRNFRTLQRKYQDWVLTESFFIPRTGEKLREFYDNLFAIRQYIYADCDENKSGDMTNIDDMDNAVESEDDDAIDNVDCELKYAPLKKKSCTLTSSSTSSSSSSASASESASSSSSWRATQFSQSTLPEYDKFFTHNDYALIKQDFEEIYSHNVHELLRIDHNNPQQIEKLQRLNGGQKLKTWLKRLHPDKTSLKNVQVASLLFQKVLYLQRF